ncbi:hypothetical protein J6590_042709 [Homalodisca vitripennis]|nr:hypothetical protein J6590_042709 [Homalodisca vitripennis]
MALSTYNLSIRHLKNALLDQIVELTLGIAETNMSHLDISMDIQEQHHSGFLLLANCAESTNTTSLYFYFTTRRLSKVKSETNYCISVCWFCDSPDPVPEVLFVGRHLSTGVYLSLLVPHQNYQRHEACVGFVTLLILYLRFSSSVVTCPPECICLSQYHTKTTSGMRRVSVLGSVTLLILYLRFSSSVVTCPPECICLSLYHTKTTSKVKSETIVL